MPRKYVLLADMIDWAAVETEYSALFKSKRGRPAASARMALGSLISQMFDEKQHRVAERIVSVTQPSVRSIATFMGRH